MATLNHEKLEETGTGNRNLMDAAYAQLPANVFLASSIKEHKQSPTKSISTSPGTSGSKKRQLAEARRAALESVDKRNVIYSKAATLELNTTRVSLKNGMKNWMKQFSTSIHSYVQKSKS